MHLCDKDDQNGRKITGLLSAAMARLTRLILTKNIFLAVNGLVCLPMVTLSRSKVLACYSRS
jgi:hypothetical protein